MTVAEGGIRWHPVLSCETCGLEHQMNVEAMDFDVFDEDFMESYYFFRCSRCIRVTLIDHTTIPKEIKGAVWQKHAQRGKTFPRRF